MNDALRDWVANVHDTFYFIGTVAGPHPYPAMVRDFQSVIGRETREQMLEAEGRLPDSLVACIGGGSNAMGLFHPFLDERGSRSMGSKRAATASKWQARRLDDRRQARRAARQSHLSVQDDDGQIEGHSISAGLDYPGVGPEHSWLKDGAG